MEILDNPAIHVGSRVVYDGTGEPEYGTVIEKWLNEEEAIWDCRIRFDPPPKRRSYVLRYSALELQVIPDK